MGVRTELFCFLIEIIDFFDEIFGKKCWGGLFLPFVLAI